MGYTSGSISYKSYTLGGTGFYSQSSQTNNYPITGEHARGYRVWFLPYTYSLKDSWIINGGRVDVYANLKQSKAQITIGDVAS